MLLYNQALEKCLETVPVLPAVEVELDGATGRYASGEIVSDSDMPPFDRSAMDGFAVRVQDIMSVPADLEVVATIPAGTFPDFEIAPGRAAHIMTGAPVPKGADTVVMIEDTDYDETGCAVRINRLIPRGRNIALRGEDIRAGEAVLSAGEQITARAVPLLASAGAARVRVGRRPSVAIVTTGSELVDICERPAAGQIRNGNLHTLIALLRSLGIEPDDLGLVPDDEARARETLAGGLAHNILIVSGGVSMGKFDIVEKALGGIGAETIFHKVAVRPGKPLLLSKKDDCTIFGLPGNPVSVFVSFKMFVGPSILKMMGARDFRPAFVPARLGRPVKMRSRMQFIPGVIGIDGGGLAAKPVEWHGSGDMAGLARCDCLVEIPIGEAVVSAGATVNVYPLAQGIVPRGRK